MSGEETVDEDGLSVSLSDVKEAMGRIRDHVHYTPVMECSYLDSISHLKLFFKCELFQKTGSFKIRGATNAIRKLCEESDSSQATSLRVVTESSGNHAQALALAAKNCDIPADIVMSSNTPAVKIRAVEGYGGIVTLCYPSEQARKDAALEIVAKYAPNAAFITSSNHPDVVAGQGTIALELLEQVPQLDAIIASVSGGGFLAGIAVAAKALQPNIKIIAAEPKNADDFAQSFAAGKMVLNKSWPDTICDSLKVNVYKETWPILKKHVTCVITVTEEEIIAAMRMIWERMKVTVEGGAACTVAAVLSPKFRELAGASVKRVGVVLCGGNVDLDNLPWTN